MNHSVTGAPFLSTPEIFSSFRVWEVRHDCLIEGLCSACKAFLQKQWLWTSSSADVPDTEGYEKRCWSADKTNIFNKPQGLLKMIQKFEKAFFFYVQSGRGGKIIDSTVVEEVARAAYANAVKQLLKRHLGNTRVISRHFPTLWPSRSPDPNPYDFWLWGCLKLCCVQYSDCTFCWIESTHCATHSKNVPGDTDISCGTCCFSISTSCRKR